MRAEVDDLPLVQAEAGHHAARLEHGQVEEGAEPPVADQQVALLEVRVQLPDLGLLVGVEREGEHLHDHAGEGVEEAKRLGDGEPASGLLAGRLPEGFLKFRRVGGDGAGAVDQERAQPAPRTGGFPTVAARVVVQRRAHRRGTVQQQLLQHHQRQAHAGTAVRRRHKGKPRQVAQVLDGGVEPEGLQHQQLYCRDRPEFTFPPIVALRVTGGHNRLVGQMCREVFPETIQRARDRCHPWPPAGKGF